MSRFRAGRLPPLPLLFAGLVVALLTLTPVIFVAAYTVSVGPDTARRLLFRPRVAELLGNSAALILTATPLCALIGTGAAWLVERSRVPWPGAWRALLAAPLAVPAFVNAYAWIGLLPRVEGFDAAVLIVTLSYFPLTFVPVAAALRGLDPELEETARSLGLGPWRTFGRVVLPQLRPALLGGMLLVALHLLAEFGALQMLRFPTFTTAIYDQYQSTFNGVAAHMLASVLVALCVVLLLGEATLRGASHYARVGRGSPRPARRVRLGIWLAPGLVCLTTLIALSLGVPAVSVARWLATGAWLTLPGGAILVPALRTFSIAAAAAATIVVLAVPVAWLAVRHRGAIASLIERSTFAGHALPGIVVALALVTVSIRFARPLYQTLPVLIAAYAILFLPLAIVSLRAGLAQAPRSLDEAARSLGKGPMATLWRVTLPLIAPAAGAGAALVFLRVITELTATLLLAPTGTETLATRFWSHADSIAYGLAAPYAALMIAVSLPATLALTRAAGWRTGATRV